MKIWGLILENLPTGWYVSEGKSWAEFCHTYKLLLSNKFLRLPKHFKNSILSLGSLSF